MNYEHRLILQNRRDSFSKKIKLEDLKPFLIEYKIFNKYMWKDINSTADMFDNLPFRGPKAFQNLIDILRKAKYRNEADSLENYKLREIPDSNLNYRMASKPLGICFIINNVNFDKLELKDGPEIKNYSKDRNGSDIDAKNLQDFFESIGFDVISYRNKKSQEMFAALKKLSSQNFSNMDALIIIILSHGDQKQNKDYICGTDWGSLSKTEICDIFNNRNCEDLQSKPKIFFFISCRGRGMDYGVPSKCLPQESIDSNPIDENLMPSLSDILVIHSTLPQQVSLRHPEKGSYFIEELISVLKEHYHIYDLETMIKFVNRNLQHKVSVNFKTVQVAHVEALGVTKRIMLCKTSDSKKL